MSTPKQLCNIRFPEEILKWNPDIKVIQNMILNYPDEFEIAFDELIIGYITQSDQQTAGYQLGSSFKENIKQRNWKLEIMIELIACFLNLNLPLAASWINEVLYETKFPLSINLDKLHKIVKDVSNQNHATNPDTGGFCNNPKINLIK